MVPVRSFTTTRAGSSGCTSTASRRDSSSTARPRSGAGTLTVTAPGSLALATPVPSSLSTAVTMRCAVAKLACRSARTIVSFCTKVLGTSRSTRAPPGTRPAAVLPAFTELPELPFASNPPTIIGPCATA